MIVHSSTHLPRRCTRAHNKFAQTPISRAGTFRYLHCYLAGTAGAVAAVEPPTRLRGDAYKPPAADVTGMDPTDLVDRVRSENRTELSRLGSSKSLYADTEGEMEGEVVLTALADTTHHAAEVFDGWGDTFAAAADRERDHYADIAGELDDHEPGDRPALVASFRGHETAVDRLGAAVGYTLVAEGKASQATGFFTGQADPGTASLFRGISDGYGTLRGELLDALEPHDDPDSAVAAATTVVGAAYEEYVTRLESMGINPKPVC
ncbi:MAG: hypothetical protein ACI9CA_000961 [Natronomonas sp.]|jgi:hypothetical protein